MAGIYSMIQVGENRYGHPEAGVFDSLSERAVLRTDIHGQIHLSSDGRRMWIETEWDQKLWYNGVE